MDTKLCNVHHSDYLTTFQSVGGEAHFYTNPCELPDERTRGLLAYPGFVLMENRGLKVAAPRKAPVSRVGGSVSCNPHVRRFHQALAAWWSQLLRGLCCVVGLLLERKSDYIPTQVHQIRMFFFPRAGECHGQALPPPASFRLLEGECSAVPGLSMKGVPCSLGARPARCWERDSPGGEMGMGHRYGQTEGRLLQTGSPTLRSRLPPPLPRTRTCRRSHLCV